MTHIALFSSGNGTNAENIAKYFSNHSTIRVSLIVSNREEAYVHQRAKSLNIPSYTFSKDEIMQGNKVLALLCDNKIDYIILAGFLLKIPQLLLDNFPAKIINIHPALLPKHGGKGMYGDNVHKRVIEAGDTESGITIHYVNNRYDEGEIIFQAPCRIFPADTYKEVAQRVHQLEYQHFPRIIEKIIIENQKSL